MERTIHSRERIGVALQIVQRSDRVIRRVPVDMSVLVVVRHGTKYVRSGDVNLTIHEGECVAIPAGRTLDMVNEPGREGVYRADCLGFEPTLLAAFLQSRPPAPALIRQVCKLGEPPAEFGETFNRAWGSLGRRDEVPDSIAEQRVTEVLLWLQLNGQAFPWEPPSSASVRVCALLRSAPDVPWKSGEVARRMGMSDATLRRHLAVENRSFSELLIDVRMSTALTLLQGTDRTITDIAFSVGYESPSRFAVRFRDRFGLSPTELRMGNAPNFERIGTDFARIGSASWRTK